MDRTFNPCDECDYAFHKQNQESGMCKICEFKQLQESQIDVIELCKIKIALDKLKEYQQLEEQGLLLRLPCKVGDEFWVIAYSNPKITNVKCTGFCIQEDTINNIKQSYVWINSLENDRDYWKLSFEDFKNQCFPTKEEAEQALQRMKEGV